MTSRDRYGPSTGAVPEDTMRGVTVPRYGGPEVLCVARLPRPTPAPGEVLVRVAWGAINAADVRLMRADPGMLRLAFGLRRPRFAALGASLSGTVVDSSVDYPAVGSRVMAEVSAVGCGAFAEYVSVPAEVLVPVPDDVPLDTAATLPLAGTTALQAVRDQAEVTRGSRVLVTGASGAVGAITVQLARAMGAEVWAVTSGRRLDMVGSLRPAHVINRDEGDIIARDSLPAAGFDVIIDTAGYRSIFDYRPVLAAQGVYVHVGGSMRRLAQTALMGALRSRRSGRRWKMFTASADTADLTALAGYASSGVVAPPVGARFPIEAAREAMRVAEEHTAPGRILLQME